MVVTAHDALPAWLSAWSSPIHLGAVINTGFTDGCPFISRDGLSLYFASNRPGGLGGLDIYVSRRPAVDVPWGEPENVVDLNSPTNELCPTLAPDDRTFLFVSDRSGGCGGQDLYAAGRTDARDDLAWGEPYNLGCQVNSSQNDFTPSLFVDFRRRAVFLYFSSTRPGVGGADIYASDLQADRTFGAPTPVYELNTPFNDQRPNVRADGREIFFDSDRPGSLGSTDLWSSTRRWTDDLWSEPASLGDSVNSEAMEGRPSVSFNGRTLYFMSSRPGSTPSATGATSTDLWVTVRKRAPAIGADE
jgi:Tol biopolymer transport system component